MIKIKSATAEFTVKPTIFPDGTSQVWKLPEDIFRSHHLQLIWNYESEREIIDILSLRKLLPHPAYTLDLHVPYLPYGRQDKRVDNAATFNLRVFADLINSCNFYNVTTVDAHNIAETNALIKNFSNIAPYALHAEAIKHSEPNYIVYPDAGAAVRYSNSLKHTNLPIVICDKVRDPLTGNILGHQIVHQEESPVYIGRNIRALIIDDLCDGGATFISVANMIRENPAAKVDLCVTHGIFSKGREALYNAGISNIYTTNSLTKNEDGYKV